MMSGRELLGVGLPLLGGVALDERLVERAADQADPLLLEVLRLGGVDLAGLLGDQRARLVGGVALAEELVDQAEVHRERVDLPLVLREDPVLVAGEVGEPVDVLPDLLVGGVEEVGAVDVHLDAGLGLGLAVGVAAEVVATLEHQHLEAELVWRSVRRWSGRRSRSRRRRGQGSTHAPGSRRSQSTDGSALPERATTGTWRMPRAARMARITLRASATPPRSGRQQRRRRARSAYGLSRTSTFSPYRKCTDEQVAVHVEPLPRVAARAAGRSRAGGPAPRRAPPTIGEAGPPGADREVARRRRR